MIPPTYYTTAAPGWVCASEECNNASLFSDSSRERVVPRNVSMFENAHVLVMMYLLEINSQYDTVDPMQFWRKHGARTAQTTLAVVINLEIHAIYP